MTTGRDRSGRYQSDTTLLTSPGRTDGLSIPPLAFAVPLLFAATWLALFGWVVARLDG